MRIVLHLGAHRTGSTMVEQAMSQTIRKSPSVRLSVWGPQHLRDIEGFASSPTLWSKHGTPVDDAAAETIGRVQDRLQQDLNAERKKGTQTLIISEENIIGSMRRNFISGKFYPKTVLRQQSFAWMMPFVPDVLAMGVRNYAAAWTSAQAYQFQKGELRELSKERCDAIPKQKRGWIQVVQASRQVWPGAGMIMWRQEDLATCGQAIVSAVCGLPKSEIHMPKKRVNAVTEKSKLPPLFDEHQTEVLLNKYDRDVMRLYEPDFSIRWISEEDDA